MDIETQPNVFQVQKDNAMIDNTTAKLMRLKIVMFIIAEIIVVLGSIFIGYLIGKNQIENLSSPETQRVTNPIITPTNIVTPTATQIITPTITPLIDSGPLKKILLSINVQLKTSYQEYTDDNGIKWKVDLTDSYNKPNILIMKKAITDFGLLYQEDLSGEAGSDWIEVYARNADTCSLSYVQTKLTLSCYN